MSASAIAEDPVRAGLAAVLFILCTTLLPARVTFADPGTPAMSATALLDSLAVNTHLNYTDGAYRDVRKVADDLAWLGVRYVRDSTPDGTAPLSSYVYLATRGIRFDFLVRYNVAESLHQLNVFNAAAPGSIASVEGLNEIDNFPVQYEGLKGDAAGLAAQKAIYADVHGDTALAGVPVYDLTGYDIRPVSSRTHEADFANAHVYPQNGEQPGWNANGDTWIAWSTDGLRRFALPLVITEFGYFSMPQSGWYQLGVDEPSQAKGVLNGLLDAANSGVARTYVYELLDEKADSGNRDGQMHFGLFRNDYSPKPAAIAIHNLTAILGERRAAKHDGGTPMAYAISGLPASGRSLLLQKDDGRYVLLLWNEVPFWNRETGTPIQSPPVDVQIDFGRTAQRVDVHDPMVAATPLAGHRNLSRLTVSVPDHPVMIEVTFANAPRT